MEILDNGFNNEEDNDFKPWGMEKNTYCMLLHLSQLSSVIIPFGGIVMPILMWATNKDQSKLIDRHGKNVLNWTISLLIYFSICFVLCFVLIGIPMIIALFIASLIFTIKGSVRANEGEIYEYPLTIKFFR